MENMTMELAQKIINQIVETAKTDGDLPVCVAVCDKAGFLVAFTKMDGTTLRSIRFSQCKAYTASRQGVTTASFLARLQRENLQLASFVDPNYTALPGGSPLITPDGTLIGAVGVSGRVAEDDQKLTDKIAAMLAAGELA